MIILYVAGPTTGLPDHNRPAFYAAAAALRSAGYAVLNPADTSGPEDAPWLWWMRQALHQLANAEGVATLPDWERSRGASLEVYVATALGLPVLTVEEWLALVYVDGVAS